MFHCVHIIDTPSPEKHKAGKLGLWHACIVGAGAVSAASSCVLALPVASARVGRGFVTIESTTRVISTGLPSRLQFEMSCF